MARGPSPQQRTQLLAQVKNDAVECAARIGVVMELSGMPARSPEEVCAFILNSVRFEMHRGTPWEDMMDDETEKLAKTAAGMYRDKIFGKETDNG